MEEGVRNIPGDERDCRRRRSLRLVTAEDPTKRTPHRKKRERRDQSAPQSRLTRKAYAFQPPPALTAAPFLGRDLCVPWEGLYHLTSPSSPAACISTNAPLLIHSRLGHPSLSKFQKMVPRFSTLSSLACESCQLGKHTRVSFLKRLNNRAKTSSPPRLQNVSSWDTLDFRRVIVVIPLTLIVIFSPLMSPLRTLHSSHPLNLFPFLKYSLPYISPLSDALSHHLQVYHRRHRVVAPPPLQLRYLMTHFLSH
ncbi:hypothetical protein CK203_021222 [Vitis vinifera]|uniref:GAG-pre-integrase domain-containing protein n=1 Tax=Vitis vinifera TaxID=29760 RepID=A0A438IMI8_VITVI|nr:hypothetical protein CK203_021222 [Vitis vinifera]